MPCAKVETNLSFQRCAHLFATSYAPARVRKQYSMCVLPTRSTLFCFSNSLAALVMRAVATLPILSPRMSVAMSFARNNGFSFVPYTANWCPSNSTRFRTFTCFAILYILNKNKNCATSCSKLYSKLLLAFPYQHSAQYL